MARRRFFVPEINGGQALIEGDEAYHLTRVLRVEPGQRYEISDGQRVFLAEVESARGGVVAFSILEPVETAAAPLVEIAVHVALFRFERLELLIEKATELGVSSLVLFSAARSEKGLDRAAAKRLPRWQRIARQAAEQSRRASLPRIEGPVMFRDALEANARCRLLLDEQPEQMPILRALPADLQGGDQVALLVGPEGGWADREREAIHRAGWQSVSLGSQILRTETAAIAALAVIHAAPGSTTVLHNRCPG